MENKSNSSTYSIERLNQDLHSSVILFLENIFNKEQNIPKNLIPVKHANQAWWCIKNGDEIVGIAAAWEDDSEWHWGRFAVHQKLRGLGLGKKLVLKSLDDLFTMGIEKVKIDARDITVDMILKLGGKITGKKDIFYGHAITPMEIVKEDFIHKK